MIFKEYKSASFELPPTYESNVVKKWESQQGSQPKLGSSRENMLEQSLLGSLAKSNIYKPVDFQDLLKQNPQAT